MTGITGHQWDNLLLNLKRDGLIVGTNDQKEYIIPKYLLKIFKNKWEEFEHYYE